MDGRSTTSAANGKRGGRPARFSDQTLEVARTVLQRAVNEDDLPGDVRNELADLAVRLQAMARR